MVPSTLMLPKEFGLKTSQNIELIPKSFKNLTDSFEDSISLPPSVGVVAQAVELFKTSLN